MDENTTEEEFTQFLDDFLEKKAKENMKLLHCPKCNDIQALILEERTCLCGATSGRYVNSNRAEVSGGNILGLRNDTFLARLKTHSKEDMPAFFIHFDDSAPG